MDYRFEDIYSRLTTLEVGAGSGGTNGYTEEISTPATEWVITHNLETFGILVQCWDGVGDEADLIFPANVNVDSTSQITIDWSGEEVSGRVAIVATS